MEHGDTFALEGRPEMPPPSYESALTRPIVFEEEYAAKIPAPADEKERHIQAEVMRLKQEYGRYVAYGLRLQMPDNTRRVLLFVASVLGGMETKLSLVGLQRIEKSLVMFRNKVSKLQESLVSHETCETHQRETVGGCFESERNLKRDVPAELESMRSPPAKKIKGSQNITIDTNTDAIDVSLTNLSPATQKILTLPGVSPSSVMGRRTVLQEKTETNKKTHTATSEAYNNKLSEPIKFRLSVTTHF